MTILVDEFKEYLLEHGFKYKGKWYFRRSWMREELLFVLNEKGLVKRLGNLRNASSIGVELPDNGKYNSSSAGSTLLYQVVNKKVNNMNSDLS